jgi:hypothetical protein
MISTVAAKKIHKRALMAAHLARTQGPDREEDVKMSARLTLQVLRGTEPAGWVVMEAATVVVNGSVLRVNKGQQTLDISEMVVLKDGGVDIRPFA